jgi:hypothetical protein
VAPAQGAGGWPKTCHLIVARLRVPRHGTVGQACVRSHSAHAVRRRGPRRGGRRSRASPQRERAGAAAPPPRALEAQPKIETLFPSPLTLYLQAKPLNKVEGRADRPQRSWGGRTPARVGNIPTLRVTLAGASPRAAKGCQRSLAPVRSKRSDDERSEREPSERSANAKRNVGPRVVSRDNERT